MEEQSTRTTRQRVDWEKRRESAEARVFRQRGQCRATVFTSLSSFPFSRSKPLGRRPLCNQTARIIEAGQRQNRGSDPYLWAFESMELDKSVFFTLSRLLPLPLSTAVLFNSSVILLRVPTILCPIPIPVIPVFLPFFFFFSNRMRIFPAPTKFYIERLISPFPVRWLQFLFCDNFIGI